MPGWPQHPQAGPSLLFEVRRPKLRQFHFWKREVAVSPPGGGRPLAVADNWEDLASHDERLNEFSRAVSAVRTFQTQL